MEFTITGRVRERESGLGVPNLIIRAYDKDLFFDDLLDTRAWRITSHAQVIRHTHKQVYYTVLRTMHLSQGIQTSFALHRSRLRNGRPHVSLEGSLGRGSYPVQQCRHLSDAASPVPPCSQEPSR